MPSYPDPATWKYANKRQAQRAARSFNALRQRAVPVYPGPLFVHDDEEVSIQPADEVARRVLVLWVVVHRAEGVPRLEVLEMIDSLELWSTVSPSEERFLQNENPSQDECKQLVWRLESIWVLMWVLGYVDKLEWPSEMCDVPKLATLVRPHEADAAFVSAARVRSTAEILDAQDLTMRIHWAIRDAYLHQGGMIPEHLDWSAGCEYVPVHLAAVVGVVEQRHYTLNWLLNFLNPQDWDHVDTPT
jgi:hypothetical protein